MTVTNKGEKYTIDPLMETGVERSKENGEDQVNVVEELRDVNVNDVRVMKNNIHMLRFPPSFPQKLVKKAKERK